MINNGHPIYFENYFLPVLIMFLGLTYIVAGVYMMHKKGKSWKTTWWEKLWLTNNYSLRWFRFKVPDIVSRSDYIVTGKLSFIGGVIFLLFGILFLILFNS